MSSCRPRDLPDVSVTITYGDNSQATKAAIEKIWAKMLNDPHYFPFVSVDGNKF